MGRDAQSYLSGIRSQSSTGCRRDPSRPGFILDLRPKHGQVRDPSFLAARGVLLDRARGPVAIYSVLKPEGAFRRARVFQTAASTSVPCSKSIRLAALQGHSTTRLRNAKTINSYRLRLHAFCRIPCKRFFMTCSLVETLRRQTEQYHSNGSFGRRRNRDCFVWSCVSCAGRLRPHWFRSCYIRAEAVPSDKASFPQPVQLLR